jgi:hypothetical protein
MRSIRDFQTGESLAKEGNILDRINHWIVDGISLSRGLKGQIITISLAPNESKVVNHGLRTTPRYRLILKQVGNAVITDVDSAWTDRTVGFLNNSTNAVTITIKLMLE